MRELAKYFKRLGKEEKRVLVLGHPHADPDAVGSVLGLAGMLDSLGLDVCPGVVSGLDKLSHSVVELVDKEVMIDPPIDVDIAVVLDTSDIGQLKGYEERLLDLGSENIIFIDHHRPDPETMDTIGTYYSDESASSSVELVLRLAGEIGYDFRPDIATLMLTGIISDTGHFKFADKETFESVTALLEDGADYQAAMDSLDVEDSQSKRVAILKSAQRSELYKAYDRWIVFSEVGAYESDAASFFIKAGADVSLVASVDNENENITRISSRSRSGLASKTHLHLGDLMSELAEEFEGTGGGHAGAAAVTVEGIKFEKLKKEALDRAKKMMKPKEEES